jgi:hypothetical protein
MHAARAPDGFPTRSQELSAMTSTSFARLARGAAAAAFALAVAACGGTSGEAAPRRDLAQKAEPQAQVAAAGSPLVTVYKSPTCGCCAKWVDHMRAAGFQVEVHDTSDVAPIKNAAGVPEETRSCHTARVGDYVLEGHVPADVVRKLLDEKPAIVGLAVPGMPMGSPGMEGPHKDPYDVLAFTRDGKTSVFASR